MLLLIDNYDSFTYNLKDYFEQLGQEVILIRNDETDAEGLSAYKFRRVVISPGPNTPAESGNLMQMIPALVGRYPVLGICLGHQALGQYFGAKLMKAQKPMHGKVSPVMHNQQGIYMGIPNPFNVCRYHSLIIEDPDDSEIRVTAQSEDGECMSFQHRRLPVFGIQFHPEAILTEHGLRLLDNWLALT